MQRQFACQSVFAGGWTVDAAARVCGLIEGQEVDVLAAQGALVEHSLVRVEGSDDAEPRYAMLQVTREYAADRLRDSPERAAIERRHAEWMLDLVETAEPELLLGDLRDWQERLRREEENLRTALRWAIEHRETELAQRMAGSCWRFWHHWGEFREGISWLRSVLELPHTETPSEPRARALSALAALWLQQGHGPESLKLSLEVIELRRALGDDERLRDALDDASWAAYMSGDGDLAMQLTEEKWRYPRRPRSSSFFDGWMDRRAELAIREYGWRHKGSYEKAIPPMEAILGDVRRSEQALFAAHATITVASFHLFGGRADRSIERARAALRLYAQLGHVGQLTVALNLMSFCEMALGRPERAVRLPAAASREAAELGGVGGSHGGPLARPRLSSARIEGARSQLSEERYARALAEGREMSLDEAVAFALSKASLRRGNAVSRRRDPDALTPRELEVLELLSDGQTDAGIGEALFISPKTVSAHVSSIKGKMGAGSRTEIVAIAIRGGLVTADP